MGKIQKQKIYLEWRDTITQEGWHYEDEAIRFADSTKGIVKDVGWLILETEDYLLMAARIYENEQSQDKTYGELCRIYKSSIIKRKKLKYGEA